MNLNLSNFVNDKIKKAVNPYISSAAGKINAETIFGSSNGQFGAPSSALSTLINKELDDIKFQAIEEAENKLNKSLDRVGLDKLSKYNINVPTINDILREDPSILISNLSNAGGVKNFTALAENANLSNVPYINNPNLYKILNPVIGMIGKLGAGKDIQNSPQQAMADSVANQQFVALQYPLGSDAGSCCFMIISAFKYIYDKNDIDGNKRSLDTDLSASVKRLYQIKLPLPANLPGQFGAQWGDYQSIWAKLAKASNASGGMADLIAGGKDTFANAIANLAGQGVVDDLKFVAGASALSALITGGSPVGESITESLNFIKVAGGITVNPMSQANYIGAQIRSHAFSFDITPRNQREQEQAAMIIEKLEDGQLGAKKRDMGGLLLDFPDMFNIRFVTPTGAPIKGMIEIPDCFIESCNVTRSPTRGIFQLTKDHWPFGYKLEIVFKEMQMLTRDDMKYLRQSDEQAAALYSGNAIPSEWDPNNTKISGDISGILGQIPPPTTDEDLEENPQEVGENPANPLDHKNRAPGSTDLGSENKINLITGKPTKGGDAKTSYSNAQLQTIAKNMQWPDGTKIKNGDPVPNKQGYIFNNGKIEPSKKNYIENKVVSTNPDGTKKTETVISKNHLTPGLSISQINSLTEEQKNAYYEALRNPITGKKYYKDSLYITYNEYVKPTSPQFYVFKSLSDCTTIKGKIPDSYASQYGQQLYNYSKTASSRIINSSATDDKGKTAEQIANDYSLEKIHQRNASCKV